MTSKLFFDVDSSSKIQFRDFINAPEFTNGARVFTSAPSFAAKELTVAETTVYGLGINDKFQIRTKNTRLVHKDVEFVVTQVGGTGEFFIRPFEKRIEEGFQEKTSQEDAFAFGGVESSPTERRVQYEWELTRSGRLPEGIYEIELDFGISIGKRCGF